MQNLIEIYKRPVQQFCERNKIQLCILFGSRVTGRIHQESDVDIALLPEDQKVDMLDLIGELTDIFHGEIDLVIIQSDTDPVLLREIFEKGILVYEKHPGLFRERKIWAWKLFQDTQKLRDYRTCRIQNYIEKINVGNH